MSDEEVQMIPVNAWFKGDHITHLVVFESNESIPSAIEKVTDLMVGKRFFKREGAQYKMSCEGTPIPNDITVGESIIKPLDEVTVEWAN
jgi:hypothetical protein